MVLWWIAVWLACGVAGYLLARAAMWFSGGRWVLRDRLSLVVSSIVGGPVIAIAAGIVLFVMVACSLGARVSDWLAKIDWEREVKW